MNASLEGDCQQLANACPETRHLWESLQCQICYNLFNGPVSLRCGHTFCSACVRQDLAFKQRAGNPVVCPACRAPLEHTEDFSANLTLREAVAAFKVMVPALVELLRKPAPVQYPAEPQAAQAAQKSTVSAHTTSNKRQRTADTEVVCLDQSDDELHRQAREGSGATVIESTSNMQSGLEGGEEVSSQGQEGRQVQQPNPDHHPQQQPAQPSAPAQDPRRLVVPPGCVPCPVCLMSIPQTLINTHLDNCLLRHTVSALPPVQNRQSGTAPRSHRGSNNNSTGDVPHAAAQRMGTGQSAGRAPSPALPSAASAAPPPGPRVTASTITAADIPPKLVFTMLKDKDLKSKVKSLGLPVDGTREELIERYNSYRQYLSAKQDAGSQLALPQLRDSFLAQQRQQQAARRANAAFGGPQLGLGVPSMGRAGISGRPGHSRHSPEVFELQGDNLVVQEQGPAEGQPAPYTFSSLISETRRRQQQSKAQCNSDAGDAGERADGVQGQQAPGQHMATEDEAE